MDPILVSHAAIHGTGIGATGHHLAGRVHGLLQGEGSEPVPFSFSDRGILGKLFMLKDKTYSLKPDLISSVPFGRSFSVYQGVNRLGFITRNGVTPGFTIGGGLSPQMGTALAASLG